MSELDELRIFFGKTASSLAHVYAELPIKAEWSCPRLTGVVRGPRAEGVRTLPTTVELVDLGPGDSVLARALIPDPVFWSPDMPAVYDVELKLRDQRGVIGEATHEFGIRQFGARGKSWFWGDRRWVLRGLLLEELSADDVELLRATNTSVVCADPDEATCETASQAGIVLVPWIAGSDAEQVCLALRRLSRRPAVSMAIIDAPLAADADLKSAAPNVELVKLCRGSAGESSHASWASAVAGTVTQPAQFGNRFGSLASPVLAVRPADPKMNVSDRRAACDRLQRDLAPYCDLAGYIV